MPVCAAGGLLEADHLASGRSIVSPGIDRSQEAPVGVAEVGHGVEGDVRHRLAEDRCGRPAGPRWAPPAGRWPWRTGPSSAAEKARAGQGEVEGGVAGADGSGRRVPDLLADVEILEEVAGTALPIGSTPAPLLRRGSARPSPLAGRRRFGASCFGHAAAARRSDAALAGCGRATVRGSRSAARRCSALDPEAAAAGAWTRRHPVP